MKAVYSPRAILDLAEISNYLTARSPTGARVIERRIRRVIGLLAEFPGAGRALDQRPLVRVMPLGRHPYLIFYSVLADEVVVLHIRHAARRPVDPSNL